MDDVVRPADRDDRVGSSREPRRARRGRRVTSVVLATALLLPMAAAAQPADDADVLGPTDGTRSEADDVPAPRFVTSQLEPRGIDRVCPPPQGRGLDLADPIEFPDLGSTHAQAITCASVYRLITGFDDGTVRPGAPVTRAQTASVVRTWIELATGFELEVPDEPPFEDVAGTHADAIAALAAIGVISGRTATTFDPDASLNRGQFSRVLANAISYADVFAVDGPLPPAPEPDTVAFDDVAGSTFEAEVLALAAARVTTGTGGGAFSPSASVTRGQLATFLMRGADYLDRHQRWRPTARAAVLVTDLAAVTVPSNEDEAATASSTAPRGTVTMVVNAFNGTLAFVADLSEVPTIRDPDARLEIRLGDVEAAGGSLVLELAGATTLAAADAGLVSGSVVEADSALRLADLVASPERAFVQLQADDLSTGPLRGALRTAR